MRIKSRFRLIVVVAAVGLFALAACWLHSERSVLLAERQEQARNLVAIPYSIISAQYKLEAEGKISREEAQKRAIEELRGVRFGGDNYFWVNDMHPAMVMHPMKPELDGKDLTGYKDPTGKAVFVEMVKTVQKDGRGFVSYRWPKPGEDAEGAVAKLSFVQGFEPWGWIIGTGVYIDDVDAAWRSNAAAAAGVGLACLLVLLVVSTSVAHSIFRRLEYLVQRMSTVARGQEDFTREVEASSGGTRAAVSHDEIGILMAAFTEMLGHIKKRDQQLQKHREHLLDEVATRTAELAAAHAEIELFLASIPSIVIGLDLEGHITRWNQTAAQTFGISDQDVKGRTLDQCGIKWLHPDMNAEVSQWLRTETIRRCDDLAYEKDHNVRFVGFCARPILSNRNEKAGFIVTGADITERKCLEEQLRQAQKLEAIGQLAAGIAHEINTPTQYIGDNTQFLKDSWEQVLNLISFCRIMQQEAALKGSVSAEAIARFDQLCERCDLNYLLQEVPQAIDQSLDGLQRVAKIVRAMKEFSHPDSEEKQAADINRTIEATLTVARAEWKHVADVDLQLDPTLPPVPCVLGELNQVVLNLVINAAHAIADVVGDGSNGKGKITVTTRQDGEWAEIAISDTGTGIPNEIQARVFEPFFTSKPVGKGTGQGLALAHTVIVKKHQGRIWFDTEPGRGTTFFIRIPLDVPVESVAR